ncbi:hypothetical protein [Metallosphaera javensis (ex Sakai et al. 2022)]|uniref:hypothetical protein n=1 Tax=Metallosphaera javensis (ex Sakai et al. 2022) TaxID=2775498 RepID=UPI00258B59E8|nr:MAG: hypothetical protein MjAS7_1921 [Metallosphaera javensis (ex Sakai et al. 2022)]
MKGSPPRLKGYEVGRAVKSSVNYSALTDGASPPHDGDFLLLSQTSIPSHP